MQNRYAGDVGDFGKFGMLRALAQSKLKIGVNWYLVPDENHNNDGIHIGYLENSTFLGCDDELLEILRLLVAEKRRSVDALAHSGLLPHAVFYHGVLYPPRTDGKFARSEWHSLAISALSDSELVFLEPDNGLLAQSVSNGARASIKYVFEEEITDYYLRGHSVIFILSAVGFRRRYISNALQR